MTNLFVKYLEMAEASAEHHMGHEYKEMVESLPPTLLCRKDMALKDPKASDHGVVMKVRELLTADAIESTTLILLEAYKTVLQGAEPAKCMRNAFPVVPTTSNQLRWPLGEPGTYAYDVAEGAEIPMQTQQYSTVMFNIGKIGVRPSITNELIDDSLYGIIDLEVQKAGLRMENKLNQKLLDQILSQADSGTYTTPIDNSTNAGVDAIADAIANVATNNFIPDTVILHPGKMNLVYRNFIPAYNPLAQQVQVTGDIGKTLGMILGLKPFMLGVTSTSTTKTWGTSAGNIYQIIADAKNLAALAMRRDITVTNYDDPIHDLKGMAVTARLAGNVLWPKAGSLVILHS